ALSGQKVDCRVDVYALGAVSYFMLSGEPPFASGDAYLDIYRQINDPPPPLQARRDASLPKPSDELIAAILRCLENAKERRGGQGANAGECLAALERTPERGGRRPPPAPQSAAGREAPLRPSRAGLHVVQEESRSRQSGQEKR